MNTHGTFGCTCQDGFNLDADFSTCEELVFKSLSNYVQQNISFSEEKYLSLRFLTKIKTLMNVFWVQNAPTSPFAEISMVITIANAQKVRF